MWKTSGEKFTFFSIYERETSSTKFLYLPVEPKNENRKRGHVEKERGGMESEYEDRDDGDFRSSYADDVDAMFLSLRDELTT